jgi:hypothetical protein
VQARSAVGLAATLVTTLAQEALDVGDQLVAGGQA